MGKKYIIDETTLTGIASAIRGKLNWPASSKIKPKNFASHLNSLPNARASAMHVAGHDNNTLNCAGFMSLIMEIMPSISDESTFLGEDLQIDIVAGSNLNSTLNDRTVTYKFDAQTVEECGRWGGIVLTFYPNGYCSVSANDSKLEFAGTYLKSITITFGTYDSCSVLQCDYWAFLR